MRGAVYWRQPVGFREEISISHSKPLKPLVAALARGGVNEIWRRLIVIIMKPRQANGADNMSESGHGVGFGTCRYRLMKCSGGAILVVEVNVSNKWYQPL